MYTKNMIIGLGLLLVMHTCGMYGFGKKKQQPGAPSSSHAVSDKGKKKQRSRTSSTSIAISDPTLVYSSSSPMDCAQSSSPQDLNRQPSQRLMRDRSSSVANFSCSPKHMVDWIMLTEDRKSHQKTKPLTDEERLFDAVSIVLTENADPQKRAKILADYAQQRPFSGTALHIFNILQEYCTMLLVAPKSTLFENMNESGLEEVDVQTLADFFIPLATDASDIKPLLYVPIAAENVSWLRALLEKDLFKQQIFIFDIEKEEFYVCPERFAVAYRALWHKDEYLQEETEENKQENERRRHENEKRKQDVIKLFRKLLEYALSQNQLNPNIIKTLGQAGCNNRLLSQYYFDKVRAHAMAFEKTPIMFAAAHQDARVLSVLQRDCGFDINEMHTLPKTLALPAGTIVKTEEVSKTILDYLIQQAKSEHVQPEKRHEAARRAQFLHLKGAKTHDGFFSESAIEGYPIPFIDAAEFKDIVLSLLSDEEQQEILVNQLDKQEQVQFKESFLSEEDCKDLDAFSRVSLSDHLDVKTTTEIQLFLRRIHSKHADIINALRGRETLLQGQVDQWGRATTKQVDKDKYAHAQAELAKIKQEIGFFQEAVRYCISRVNPVADLMATRQLDTGIVQKTAKEILQQEYNQQLQYLQRMPLNAQKLAYVCVKKLINQQVNVPQQLNIQDKKWEQLLKHIFGEREAGMLAADALLMAHATVDHCLSPEDNLEVDKYLKPVNDDLQRDGHRRSLSRNAGLEQCLIQRLSNSDRPTHGRTPSLLTASLQTNNASPSTSAT